MLRICQPKYSIKKDEDNNLINIWNNENVSFENFSKQPLHIGFILNLFLSLQLNIYFSKHLLMSTDKRLRSRNVQSSAAGKCQQLHLSQKALNRQKRKEKEVNWNFIILWIFQVFICDKVTSLGAPSENLTEYRTNTL